MYSNDVYSCITYVRAIYTSAATVNEPKPKTAVFVRLWRTETEVFFGATIVVFNKAISGRSFRECSLYTMGGTLHPCRPLSIH